ncbi:hypothetical protein [Helicobacter pylori]|uniref:hypothetical protein n=1 Tax=Helicobacter pylori TaxID=210 RepID=UPI0009AF2C8C|nr:hypothetical protein [Helicobacter pylori]
MFADKQTPISEALASMDKSASQFESAGVSRSCFCVSKIKQDSANLASAQEFEKPMRCLGRFRANAPLV